MIPVPGYPVEETVAEALSQDIPFSVEKTRDNSPENAGSLFIKVTGSKKIPFTPAVPFPDKEDWIGFHGEEDRAWLVSSQPGFLYSAYTWLKEQLFHLPFTEGTRICPAAFSREKATFDLFLTQYARTVRSFDRERYIREYARLGFTHIEVNALAGPEPLETGIPGEFYREFYTYCPALDQFVSSSLNRGVYPKEVLRANLERLKENAEIAVRYGLTPGLLCFEPRSVPESLLRKFPTLRGARVDHPMRSFKPRYSLALAHPEVKKHYAELITSMLEKIPELEFLTIWTNDSGAGFEHTRSLYVGRNGGPYLIREWKSDEDIAAAAADNAADFLELLRDSGRRINPRFRVITRLESFFGERKYLWPRFRRGLDVEGHSLLTKGWEARYPHPRYPEIKVAGSALQNRLDAGERIPLKELHARASEAWYYHAFGSHTNHEPLLGIPFPWLTYEKLIQAKNRGISSLSHIGGIQPPDKVPFAVNQEIFRRFQFSPRLNIDEAVRQTAEKFSRYPESLFKGWKETDKAVRRISPLSIYTHYGMVWQRIIVRPLVPDISRIPEKDRAYYEEYMCSSMHNPNRVDLGRDVLFELVEPEYAETAAERLSREVHPCLERALRIFKKGLKKESSGGAFEDQYWRIRAFKCWTETLRNTAVWIHCVNLYMDSDSGQIRRKCRERLRNMAERESANTREWLEIWNNSPVEWMIISGHRETPFVYGENFGVLLRKKIELIKQYRDAEPFIDRDFMYRM